MPKSILIGVTGGIACYKTLDICSTFIKKGYEANVIMTKNATEFVTPLSFQTITNNAVYTDTFERPQKFDVEHIALAKKADILLIAPATANVISKIAHGISDDMLTTTVLACKCPIVIAPAMNTAMYENKIIQQNIEKLKNLGFIFIEPASGRLACGDEGKGKLADVFDICEKINDLLNPKMDLVGKNILVSAGPTIESLDPFRYITNHSSGKMGYSICKKALERGANVTLVSGPTNLDAPKGVLKIDVKTALEMQDAMHKHFKNADIVIKSAAVSDYRPAEIKKNKMKKSGDDLTINLVKNPDILKGLGEIKTHQKLVGFAAETENLEEYAKEKILSKNLDLIVANNISVSGAGFKGDTNIATIIRRDFSSLSLDKLYKEELADIILDEVIKCF